MLSPGIVVVAAWLAIGSPSVDLTAAPQGGQTSIAASGGLEVLQLRPNFFMIAGGGGNVGVQIGDDGVVVVDAGSSATAGDVLAAIQKLTPRPIRYIIDTSADPDHVGGNETISKAGQTLFTSARVDRAARQLPRRRRLDSLGREGAVEDERADRAGRRRFPPVRGRRRPSITRGSTCSSTAKASRSCISRRRTPTAMSSSSSAAPTWSSPATFST